MAAQIAIAGLDPIHFLQTRDSFERTLMIMLSQKIMKYKTDLDHNQAVNIANQVGKLFKR